MILCLIISLCGCNQKEDFNKTVSNNNEVVVPKEPEYEDTNPIKLSVYADNIDFSNENLDGIVDYEIENYPHLWIAKRILLNVLNNEGIISTAEHIEYEKELRIEREK